MESTLQRIHNLENHFLDFIENNTEVSDFVLKKEYNSLEDPVMDLCELIDNLFYEERVKRVYEIGSQVPFYRLAS
ncbi:MAG: hypothetical protein U0469_00045 [Candidatus Paceibacterota bacterium]|jgi:hypothetical protein